MKHLVYENASIAGSGIRRSDQASEELLESGTEVSQP